MPVAKNYRAQSFRFFWSLPYYQKMRWIAHLFKVKIKHKERRRSLALAALVEPGGTIFDVGAHLGYLSKEMATAHNGNINIIWNNTLDEVLGDEMGVTGIRIKNKLDDSTQEQQHYRWQYSYHG